MKALAQWLESMPWQSAFCFGFAAVLAVCVIALLISVWRDPVRRHFRRARKAKHHRYISNREAVSRAVCSPEVTRGFILALQANRRKA